MNRETLAMAVIKMGRRLAGNTFVQRIPATTWIYRRVFRIGYPEGIVMTQFRSLQLSVPTSDVTIAPGLIGGFYESMELDLFEQLAARSRLLVDVGGNIGLYACLAAKHAPDGAVILCFEPVPQNIEFLRRNLELNDSQSVKVIEAAVGDEDESSITIFESGSSIGTHSVSARNSGGTQSITVPVRSIDGYLSSAGYSGVDVIKVDVEGYELAVLRGAQQTLRSDQPSVFIEFAPSLLRGCDTDPLELIEFLMRYYDKAFVIDEARRRIDCRALDDLRALCNGGANVNLVLARRQEHVELLERALLR